MCFCLNTFLFIWFQSVSDKKHNLSCIFIICNVLQELTHDPKKAQMWNGNIVKQWHSIRCQWQEIIKDGLQFQWTSKQSWRNTTHACLSAFWDGKISEAEHSSQSMGHVNMDGWPMNCWAHSVILSSAETFHDNIATALDTLINRYMEPTQHIDQYVFKAL